MKSRDGMRCGLSVYFKRILITLKNTKQNYPKTSLYRHLTATTQFVVLLNALFFLVYGFQALHSRKMIEEFKRFGMTDSQRRLTGVLQISGSAGLLAGFTVMMLVAFIVRIKIKDSFIPSSPSLFFMLVNAWLTIVFYNLLK